MCKSLPVKNLTLKPLVVGLADMHGGVESTGAGANERREESPQIPLRRQLLCAGLCAGSDGAKQPSLRLRG